MAHKWLRDVSKNIMFETIKILNFSALYHEVVSNLVCLIASSCHKELMITKKIGLYALVQEPCLKTQVH